MGRWVGKCVCLRLCCLVSIAGIGSLNVCCGRFFSICSPHLISSHSVFMQKKCDDNEIETTTTITVMMMMMAMMTMVIMMMNGKSKNMFNSHANTELHRRNLHGQQSQKERKTMTQTVAFAKTKLKQPSKA